MKKKLELKLRRETLRILTSQREMLIGGGNPDLTGTCSATDDLEANAGYAAGVFNDRPRASFVTVCIVPVGTFKVCAFMPVFGFTALGCVFV